jgi:hypothetical protein
MNILDLYHPKIAIELKYNTGGLMKTLKCLWWISRQCVGSMDWRCAENMLLKLSLAEEANSR